MAQNIIINGNNYNDVPALNIPKQGGGTSTFIDETSAVLYVEQTGKTDAEKAQARKNIGIVDKPEGVECPLYFEAAEANSTVQFYQHWAGTDWEGSYSTDLITWTTYPASRTSPVITLTNVGDRVYFKGTMLYTGHRDYEEGLYFIMTGLIKAGGNIMSMSDGDNFATATQITRVYQFGQMFYNCTSLLTPPLLPATTCANADINCVYDQLFSGCSNLRYAPELNLQEGYWHCYFRMFEDCISLTKAPELPATTLSGSGCYREMFSGCISLTTPPELPATTLASSCYNRMFSGCSSLKNAPHLPALNLAKDCYSYMFSGCTSLTTAPKLPATTLQNYCYNSMFYGCTSLVSAPELDSTTLAEGCYQNMFLGCSSLVIPSTLPATALYKNCYNEMFFGCSSLKEIPVLPATTLAESCYSSMFYNCTSLIGSTTKTADCSNPYRIPTTGTGTIGTDSLNNMFSGCTGLPATPTINTTYYFKNKVASEKCDVELYNFMAEGTSPKKINYNNYTSGLSATNIQDAIDELKSTQQSVNDATLTIQKNGTTVQTFTANSSTNKTANITVPTKVSELTNDSGYTTNIGTITGITMNGSSKGTSGVVNLGTVLTSHQDISGKENTSNKVTAWSSTTTDAHYPSEKLVKSALDGKASTSVVTTSANGLMSAADKTKLDGVATGATANTGTVTSVAVKMNGATKGTVTTSGTIDLGTVITSHQDISGKANLTGATFTGTVCIPYGSTLSTSSNQCVAPSSYLIAASPMAGDRTWHDLFAFCKISTPQYYTSTDNSTWTLATLNKNLFAQQGQYTTQILTSTITGARWVWGADNSLAWSGGEWLVLGVTYTNPMPSSYTVKVEYSADSSTWTTMHESSGNSSTKLIYYRLSPQYQGNRYIRLTITKSTTDTASLNIAAIQLLTARYGDSGKGNEIHYPYTWDADQKMTFTANQINGVTVPSTPKFTDTVTTATTTGSGNAVTAITASNGALTVTKGTTFLTSHQDISGKENSSNKVTSISSASTDTQYPSALAVYNYVNSAIVNAIEGSY